MYILRKLFLCNFNKFNANIFVYGPPGSFDFLLNPFFFKKSKVNLFNPCVTCSSSLSTAPAIKNLDGNILNISSILKSMIQSSSILKI